MTYLRIKQNQFLKMEPVYAPIQSKAAYSAVKCGTVVSKTLFRGKLSPYLNYSDK